LHVRNKHILRIAYNKCISSSACKQMNDLEKNSNCYDCSKNLLVLITLATNQIRYCTKQCSLVLHTLDIYYQYTCQIILGYPVMIPLATSTPRTIRWISFDLPLNEYYHFIGFIPIFGWARWPMKTIYSWERLSDWTAHNNASYRFSAADSKLF